MFFGRKSGAIRSRLIRLRVYEFEELLKAKNAKDPEIAQVHKKEVDELGKRIKRMEEKEDA